MYEMDQQEEYCYLFLSSIGDVVESGESCSRDMTLTADECVCY